MAAVVPIALVIEKMRNTVSSVAATPGARSPTTPDHVTPAALPVMATTNGTSFWATAVANTASRSPPWAASDVVLIRLLASGTATPNAAALAMKSRRVKVGVGAWARGRLGSVII